MKKLLNKKYAIILLSIILIAASTIKSYTYINRETMFSVTLGPVLIVNKNIENSKYMISFKFTNDSDIAAYGNSTYKIQSIKVMMQQLTVYILH